MSVCAAVDCTNEISASRTYCSRVCCARTHGKRDKRGSNNPKWRGGMVKHPLYQRWQQMIERCTCETHVRFADYGGRGITVCSEWLGVDGFWRFAEYMGEPPDNEQRWTIDRIDNDANYEPGNVRWATYSQQSSNRRRHGWESRARNKKGQFV